MAEQFDLFGAISSDKEEMARGDSKDRRILYFDLETQKSADEVGGWENAHKMKLAVGAIWDSFEERNFTFLEVDSKKLVKKLRSADLVVGFNVVGFDYTVLQPYADIDLSEIPTFDILLDIHKKLGFRISLNNLAQQTLNAKKSADGLLSLKWWKEGKINQIIEYCIKDVEITRDLFLFGVKNGYVEFLNKNRGSQKLEVDWKVDESLIAP